MDDDPIPTAIEEAEQTDERFHQLLATYASEPALRDSLEHSGKRHAFVFDHIRRLLRWMIRRVVAVEAEWDEGHRAAS